MLKKMQRIYLLYARDRQDELVLELQRLGVLHLEEVKLEGQEELFGGLDFLEGRERVENLLLKARGILDLFAEVDLVQEPQSLTYPAKIEESFQEFKERLEMLEGTVGKLVSERRELSEKIASIERFSEIISATDEMLKNTPMAGFHIVPVIIEAKDKGVIDEIKDMLEQQLPDHFALGWQQLSEKRLELIIGIDPEYATALEQYLEAKGISKLLLPPHVPADLSFLEGIELMKQEREKYPKRLEEINKELKALSEEWSGKLAGLTLILENRLAQLEASSRFGYTNYTLLISGWIPQDELARLKTKLGERFPEIVIRESKEHFSQEEVPVAFQESSWSRPYELFMSILPLPKYNTVDPTPFFSIFFPLFFGIMVGDFGYGALMLLLSLYIRKKFVKSKLVSYAGMILLQGASSAILFGILFGEFFGEAFWKLFGIEQAPWPHFNREQSMIPFMIFTIALGVLKVFLGLILGSINALREKKRKHFLEKISTPLVVLGLGMAFGVAKLGLPSDLFTPGMALMIVGLPLLLYGGGIMGLLEIVSVVGNILSYVRIMAIGMASLLLAKTANELGGMMGNILLAVVIAIMFHTLNFVLAIFDPTIQSARLHYVEFFRQFFEGGGKKYEPFKEIKLERSCFKK